MNRRQYASFHLLRVFFEDLDAWRGAAPLAGIASTLTQQDYDDLFKGTRADVYVPLWASACLSGMDILLNEITLECILTYKKYGYAPVRMDGNPPDYIGEQLRFLEYLARCALRGDGEAAAPPRISSTTSPSIPSAPWARRCARRPAAPKCSLCSPWRRTAWRAAAPTCRTKPSPPLTAGAGCATRPASRRSPPRLQPGQL